MVGEESFAKVCELASGTVVTAGQLVPYLGRCQIERIVFDGPSRVIDVGIKRFFGGALRRAIEVRDGYCQHESGCDEPASRCEVDHIVPYSHGGSTSQGNGQLLCSKHNRGKGARSP
jgi:5-methylcytosine-specific restriction protein A